MKTDSYQAVMDQKAEIMRASVGIDYGKYTTGPLSFDYEAMLHDTGYDLDAIRDIQGRSAVGDTPLVELKHLTELVRALSGPIMEVFGGLGIAIVSTSGGVMSDRKARQQLRERVGELRVVEPGEENA